MKGATPGYWLLVALTMGVYGATVFWTLPQIRAEAGGLVPFDLRPTGYGFADAQAFLTALSPEGRALYAGAQAMLDAVYPPLLFASLGIALWYLSADLRQITRYMLVAVAAIGMAADGFENVAVRDMLIAGAEGITPAMVANASLLTVAKSAANAVSLAALAGLVLRYLMRRKAG